MAKKRNNRTRYQEINRREIQPAREKVREVENLLRKSNKVCLIPIRLGEDGHTSMNNCHVIGEKFIGLIATDKKGEVCGWEINPIAVGTLPFDRIQKGKILAEPYEHLNEPFHPRRISKSDCKYYISCRYHDSKTFRKIDDPNQIDYADSETMFLLGFRTFVSTIGLLNGHNQWIENEYKSYMEDYLQRFSISLPKRRKLLLDLQKNIDGSVDNLLRYRELLKPELRIWQEIYYEQDWNRAIHCHETITTNIRVAGTGLMNADASYQCVFTILPKGIIAQGLYEHDVIVTSISPDFPISDKFRSVFAFIENNPASDVIEYLASELFFFFYCSPDDYYNERIITPQDRDKLEIRLGNVKLGEKWFDEIIDIGRKG